jgi:hypothetical protein
MFYPFSRAWTPAQKWIIAGAISFGLILLGALIYGYELHLRHSIEDTLLDHQWSEQGCMDCSSDVTFRRDGTVEVEDTGVGQTYRGTGTWQLHGRDYIVLNYDLRIVGAEELGASHYHSSLHIDKLTSDELHADNMLYPILYKRAK